MSWIVENAVGTQLIESVYETQDQAEVQAEALQADGVEDAQVALVND